jgi:hypothetical protein
MKILNISQQDFANFQWDNCGALRSVGLDCDSIVAQKHGFYSEQSEVAKDLWDIADRIKNYDVIQFFHDNTTLYNLLKRHFGNKKIIAYHTSSYYRKKSTEVNYDMQNAHVHVAAMPEFMAMCPKAIYMVGAVDTDKIKPGDWKPEQKPVFAHYPSNSTVKGTAKINEMMSKISAKYICDMNIVPYAKQLERMSQCDVYIEMFTEKDGNGSPYGDFGITALEAAAMGKVVITNSKQNHENLYVKTYGLSFFYAANSEHKFVNFVRSLNSNKELLEGAMQKARELVVKNHSYKATGEYFLKHILKP